MPDPVKPAPAPAPAPRPAPKPAPADPFAGVPDDEPRHDTTVPGGRYIDGGRRNPKDDKHYGGKIRDAHGAVLAEFGDKEVNPGKDWDGKTNKVKQDEEA